MKDIECHSNLKLQNFQFDTNPNFSALKTILFGLRVFLTTVRALRRI